MTTSARVGQVARAEVVESALTLIGFDTANPPGETREAVTWLGDALEGAGLSPRYVATDRAKPNLIAELPGRREEQLLFAGHVDTVPFAAEEWSVDPLGDRRADRLYGRGATDMKGPLAAMLEVVLAFAQLEVRPPVTLCLLVVSDEEVAGQAGLPTVIDAGAIEADACVVGETTCEAAHHSIAVADRGSIWLTLDATGKSAHGSRPMAGINAIDRLYAAIETIRERVGGRPMTVPSILEPIIDESIEYYAATMGEATARALFTAPTINVGELVGGGTINRVPERASARLDVRLPPGMEAAPVLEDLRSCAASCDGVSIVEATWADGTYDDPAGPLPQSLATVAESVVGEHIFRRSATGGGDAKRLRSEGIPTVEFALGTDTVHAVDEYTTVGILERNVDIYAGLPFAYADALRDVR